MRPIRLLPFLAIAAALSGAPPATSAADSTMPFLDVAPETIEIAVMGGAVVAVCLGIWVIALVWQRRASRRTSASDLGGLPASGGTAEEKVTAALHRRTLRRAHIRMDDGHVAIGAAADRGGGVPSARGARGNRPPRRTSAKPPRGE